MPVGGERLLSVAPCSPLPPIDDEYAIALHGRDRRKRPHLPQPLAWTERQIETGRIGAVDDVHIVVAGKDEHPLSRVQGGRQQCRRILPIRPSAGIRHVAGDQNEIERVGGMDGGEARHNAQSKPIIAAGAGAAAFDAKSVALADHVDIGQMRDAPRAACPAAWHRMPQGRAAAPSSHRRCPRRATRPPDSGDDHDRIGERRDDEALQHHEFGHGRAPTR